MRCAIHAHQLVTLVSKPFGVTQLTMVLPLVRSFPVGIRLSPTLLKILPVGIHLWQGLGLLSFLCIVEDL